MIVPACDRRLADWLVPFQVLFTRPTWQRARVLVEGAILTPHRRTISAALRATGKSADAGFALYHAVLNRCRWSALAAARILFLMLVDRFASSGPVVIGLDDTIERRWGAKIKARGIYRDPVRSSHGHFVKASGLRWLSAMLLVPVPWAGRVWALPFLTVLMASERAAAVSRVRHKTLVDGARQMMLQIARWLPGRAIVVVADSAFAAINLLAAVRTRVSVVTRLRLDARLFGLMAPRETGTIGRPRRNGERLPTLAQRLLDPQTAWKTLIVQGWYGETERRVEVATGIAVWSHPGRPIVPLRWLLVRDPLGLFRPQAFLCTDQGASPEDILSWFVRRWTIEVTFAEVRRHLGVETQRQWSDRAIARTTPVLLGLYALITVGADDLHQSQALVVRSAKWYRKTSLTFADAIAAVRRQIWAEAAFTTSPAQTDLSKIPGHIYDRLADLACYAA
ncbi:IS701 family transposase [Lichenifustis flavocetrariae]|uniref:Transposase n=1 Tax=Lichenifustis flavocetrariae TaxID=2949735 RepID=A0AA42CMX9_9HYPH|nr:transposase [Lichenifustis flavocetrariae]MCW6513174.1 transposase [Lichenifustis flavocetrariae]